MKELEQKFLCKKGFIWNLTKPYFEFKVGQYYSFISKAHEVGIVVYSSTECGYIVAGEDKFSEIFISIEKIREDKLNKILGN